MRHHQIVELAAPVPGSDPGAVLAALRAVATMQRALEIARAGNDDLFTPAEALLDDLLPSPHRARLHLVALRAGPRVAGLGRGPHGLPMLRATDDFEPDDLLGDASATVPLRDNLDLLGDIELGVQPHARRLGIGRALAGAMQQVAGALGRRTLQAWSEAAVGAGGDLLWPAQGDAPLARDAGVEFALAMGYQLAQTDRHSVQQVATAPSTAPRVPAGYRIESWPGPAPERYWEMLAGLLATMSVDIPQGEFDSEPEIWDAERYRDHQSRLLRTRDTLTSLAIHLPSGQPAGFTELVRGRHHRAPAMQWNTLVVGEHRGHGLGLALKLANLALLREHWPQVERVHTWNAGENDRMWAINQRLGFEIVATGAGWQKKLG